MTFVVIALGGALLAGYVEVEDGAFVAGNCVVHQFVRVGRRAMLRGLGRRASKRGVCMGPQRAAMSDEW